MIRLSRIALFVLLLLSASWIFEATLAHAAVLNHLNSITTISSTVPSNGDVNPYGIALVEHSSGRLHRGHILISNFNNSANQQGTGTTIVDVAPNGSLSVFAQITALPTACPGGIGLTTALSILRSGWVILGSLPTTDGTSATIGSGCLIVLDNQGKPVDTIFGSLVNGPWDMTAWEQDHHAALFVSNVLDSISPRTTSGNQGNIVRIDLDTSGTRPAVEAMTVIASGFPTRTDPAALIIGPTGLALGGSREDSRGEENETGPTLYVADTLGNRIAAIRHPLRRTNSAGTGSTVTANGTLNGPLGLTTGPDGHLFAVNSNDGFITEVDPEDGDQVASRLLDSSGGGVSAGAGTLFGLIFVPEHGIYFVDDGTNTLNLLH